MGGTISLTARWVPEGTDPGPIDEPDQPPAGWTAPDPRAVYRAATSIQMPTFAGSGTAAGAAGLGSPPAGMTEAEEGRAPPLNRLAC